MASNWATIAISTLNDTQKGSGYHYLQFPTAEAMEDAFNTIMNQIKNGNKWIIIHRNKGTTAGQEVTYINAAFITSIVKSTSFYNNKDKDSNSININ